MGEKRANTRGLAVSALNCFLSASTDSSSTVGSGRDLVDDFIFEQQAQPAPSSETNKSNALAKVSRRAVSGFRSLEDSMDFIFGIRLPGV